MGMRREDSTDLGAGGVANTVEELVSVPCAELLPMRHFEAHVGTREWKDVL